MILSDDYNELHVLLRAIMVLKFEVGSSDNRVRECAGSKILAKALIDICDAMREMSKKAGHEENVKYIDQGLRRPDKIEMRYIKSVCGHVECAEPYWSKLSHEQKDEYLRVLFSPMEMNNEARLQVLKMCGDM
ncbi:hypothetical protein Pla110_13620 [Polystyrenella longa]|uniref:Uncharacterized protein n=1 Tax=Polystyrenella longa TaxID=2528007 RepID=A0A518CKA9_9PLAN|nr:hypothetical protein [Polystyrenella longa]QDU79651.1 hypothetical protein Pla110_13620 [Polystyrenella longa]